MPHGTSEVEPVIVSNYPKDDPLMCIAHAMMTPHSQADSKWHVLWWLLESIERRVEASIHCAWMASKQPQSAISPSCTALSSFWTPSALRGLSCSINEALLRAALISRQPWCCVRYRLDRPKARASVHEAGHSHAEVACDEHGRWIHGMATRQLYCVHFIFTAQCVC